MRWVSVKDELPKKDGFYWCYLGECPPQSYPQQAIRFKERRWWTSWVVSHWMELPKSPNACAHENTQTFDINPPSTVCRDCGESLPD